MFSASTGESKPRQGGLKVLVVGSGGREHALCWKISQSGLAGRIFASPGNPGMAEVARCFKVKADDIDGLVGLAEGVDADLVVVGPEVPLAMGLADRLIERGRKAFGPVSECARLESSKAFAKQVMQEAGVPTASSRTFDTPKDALEALSGIEGPIVVKLDGLAAGKGVVVAENTAEAAVALSRFSSTTPGAKVLLEERLTGAETSLLCICDGKRALPLMPAKDYKRALDGDRGPNTGGMGAVAPSPFVGMDEAYELTGLTVEPILRAMAARGTPYRGLLYAGLMLTPDGPKVLEYNCRFGDPETQAVLPLMEDDLLEVMLEACQGQFSRDRLKFSDKSSVCLVMASKGYPGLYDKDFEIGFAGQPEDGVMIFHAGTSRDKEGRLLTDGGRVLAISASGRSVEEARGKAYRAAGTVDCPNLYFRGDIGSGNR